MPVWTDEEAILVKRFGAELVKKEFLFSGFGGSTQGVLYRMNFIMDGIIFPRMLIIASSELQTTFNFIISASMLDGLIYQIDTVHHVLNIDIPDCESNVRNRKLRDKNGNLFVLSGDNDV